LEFHEFRYYLDFTKKTYIIANECGIAIKGLSINSIIKKALAEKPFEVNIQQQSKVSFCSRDDLVLLDKGSFYKDDKKGFALVFHSMEDRLNSLKLCFEELKLFNARVSSGDANDMSAVANEIEVCILDYMGVMLPFKLMDVIKVLSTGTITSAYLLVYLCPLRDHIGKDQKSKTGTLLRSIEDEFFKGDY
jgi:hypothetical protein